MAPSILTLFCWLGAIVQSSLAVETRRFPDSFKFGAATAAYQVEGGWDADGKGENIWDHLVHTRPDYITNGDNGDVACDSYHKYKDDVALLKELGADYYRFSIAWSRVIPTGLAGSPINPAGIQYYKNLIQELVDNGIEPVVTIYHWDLPQVLSDVGGWPNAEIIDHYAYYVTTLFENFGDDVKLWFTFNEPIQTCLVGYGLTDSAPAFGGFGIADYRCAHNIIRSHARAYHIYQDQFKDSQGGRIGMVVDSSWFTAGTDSDNDKEAAERALQFTYGWYVNPIFYGDYPQVMIDRIAERSRLQGYNVSRLPKFTDEEIEYQKNTVDFITLNIYGANLVFWKGEADASEFGYWSDLQVAEQGIDGAPGIRGMLNWLKNTYNNPEIIITENGLARPRGLDDTDRVEFMQDWLSYVLEALLDDGVNVTRYTAWSLIDTFEWRAGYSTTLGLYEVDFDDPDRPRTAKASARFYQNLIATRCLTDTCDG